MRTPSSGTGRRILALTGAALAGTAFAVAPLAPALAVDTPAQDLSITLTPDVNPQPLGDAMIWGVGTNSNVKTGYTATVELPAGLEARVFTPGGFSCTVSTNKRNVACTISDATGPQSFALAVKGTKVGTYTAKATIDGDAPDANPADNTTTTTMNITARKSASVKGVVWEDTNGNGRKDRREKGVAGAKVMLFIRDAPTPIAKAVTTSSGAYKFTLDMTTSGGNWFTLLVGSPNSKLKATFADVGSDTGDSDMRADAGTAGQRKNFDGLPVSGDTVYLEAGDHPVLDAGLTAKAPTGHVQGRIWHDLDKDGVMDAGEQGVAGVTVVLSDHTGSAPRVHTAKTDSNGRYLFKNLPIPTGPGDPYAIFVASPKGWKWAPNQHSNPAGSGDLSADVRKALGTDKNVQWTFVGPTRDDANAMVAGLTKLTDDDTLPTTGANAGGLAAGGGALLVGGAGALFLTRRRGVTA